MRWCTALLGFGLALAASGREDTTMPKVPARLVSAVEGRWELWPEYHVTFARAGEGLVVHQETETRQGERAVRDGPVEYDARDQTLRFNGIGAIHRTRILLRLSDGGIEYAIGSEISPGRWTSHPWEKARRAPAGSG